MRRSFLLSFALALAVSVAAYVIYSYFAATQQEITPSQIAVDIPLYAPQQAPSSLPAASQPSSPQPSPQRMLIEHTAEQLDQFKPYLPEEAAIATYPVSETHEKAALGSADFGRGLVETVVVYSTPATGGTGEQPLTLALLAPEGNRLTIHAKVRLAGNYVQNNIFDKQAVPFALHDVTGDGRPDIIVTSATGASLGESLAVFSVEDSTLHQVGDVAGDIIDLQFGEGGQPSRIVARSRHESTAVIYEWVGKRFTSVSGTVPFRSTTRGKDK
jgi:hypothetical protein